MYVCICIYIYIYMCIYIYIIPTTKSTEASAGLQDRPEMTSGGPPDRLPITMFAVRTRSIAVFKHSKKC